MAFTSGTATSHADLLLKLKDYLVLQLWTLLVWSPGATITDESKLLIQGPGAGADKKVYLNIRTVADATNAVYSWDIQMAAAYDAAVAFGSQLGNSPRGVFLNTWQNAITYWFYVNGRRVIIVAKCGTNYMSAHAGMFLPWGTPATYPFPLYVAGDYWQGASYSLNNSARRHCFDPGAIDDNRPNAWTRAPSGVWYMTRNHSDSALTNYCRGHAKGAYGHTWPFNDGYGHGNAGAYNPIWWCGGYGTSDHSWNGEFMVPTQQNERPLMPIMLMAGDQAPLGVIDGAYAVPGQGLVPEQLITIGARNFRVFQNIQRNSGDDFFAVEEI